MRAFVVIATFVMAASGAPVAEQQYAPIPYQFAYKAESEEGAHGHSETSDGNGNSQGEYFIRLADGRSRSVRYTADANGFVAKIETNELGTESKDAADATYTSSAITGYDAAFQYGAAAPADHALQKVKVVQTPAPVTKVASPAQTLVKTYQTAPALTTIKTVQAAPIVKAYTADYPVTVVKTAAAPTVVKTIQTAPVQYAYAQTPVQYTYAHHEGDHHIIAHH
ncbi:cuticle protein 16.8-like [Varroa jacobsoni]|uniref:cuticle protein 16.8-like n=1 Tax=Varroa jacobsoni TaxID=62625 RepID=UPI000BF45055|nr:cuticle protein 16.8-like [Varroa jacobsoni]